MKSSALSGCLRAAGNFSLLLETELIHSVTIKEKRRTLHSQSLSEQFPSLLCSPMALLEIEDTVKEEKWLSICKASCPLTQWCVCMCPGFQK